MWSTWNDDEAESGTVDKEIVYDDAYYLERGDYVLCVDEHGREYIDRYPLLSGGC